MSSERPLPVEEEWLEHRSKADASLKKALVASAVGGVTLIASSVFPPAMGGFAVGLEEMFRQAIKANSEVNKARQKYPGMDANKDG